MDCAQAGRRALAGPGSEVGITDGVGFESGREAVEPGTSERVELAHLDNRKV